MSINLTPYKQHTVHNNKAVNTMSIVKGFQQKIRKSLFYCHSVLTQSVKSAKLN
jgi:hypothetical protein